MIPVSLARFTKMHDWHLANELLKTVLDYADKNGLKNVSKVEIELGSILDPENSPNGEYRAGHREEILPENLIHNFSLLAEKTIAKDAKLKIKKIRGDEWNLISIEGQNR